MSDAQHLDAKRVAEYLAEHLPGFDGKVDVTKFATGQSNPTFKLATRAGDYVLRRKPPGTLLKSAHAVDREFRVQKALADTGVPVPRMHVLCEDENVIGSMFYVMDFVPGRNFAEPAKAGETADERGAVIGEMCRVLAELHRVDLARVGLEDYGAPGHYLARQIQRWTKQYRATETQAIADMDRLMDRMNAELPDDDGQRTLVHGDYRIDNMMFDAVEPRCKAVLDWELSTLGHPYADLAAVIMQWQLPPGSDGRGMMGLDRAALGLPSDEEFIASYCEKMGLSNVKHFNFFLGFAFFRMGAIIQGVLKRALDGNASNPEHAMQLGKFVPMFAHMGLQSLDRRLGV